jgi:hypothetical protein
VQRLPVCFKCPEVVEHDPVFEAPCGHDHCSSVVFHPLCLMEWREHRAKLMERFGDAMVIVFERRRR